LHTSHAARGVAIAMLAATLLTTGSAAGAPTRTTRAHPQFGLDSYVSYRCQGLAAYEHDATVQVDDDRSLGANSIAFAFPLYMPTRTSDLVAARLDCHDPEFETPTLGLVGKLIGIAHHAGLAVLLRPLVSLTSPGRVGTQKGWRGIIAPTDPALWFAQYFRAIRPFLVLAQADHVEHVAVASELDSLAGAPQWPVLIAKAKALYTGNLVFDYSWNMPEAKVWEQSTSDALDAYPDLTDSDADQSSAQLLAQWDRLLATRADYAVPSLSAASIDEVGILAQVGAFADPAASALPLASHPFDQSIQVRWFDAACAFVKQHHLRGLYFWGAWLSRNGGSLPTAPSPGRPSDIQPAAQVAIRECFS
jgi:hypothetical protein